MTAKKPSTSHDKRIIEELRADPEFARAYIKVALEEEGDAVMQMALRRLALAYGMAKVAKEAGVSRETLYRTLSPAGNPTLRTIEAVARVLGARLTLEWTDSELVSRRRRRKRATTAAAVGSASTV